MTPLGALVTGATSSLGRAVTTTLTGVGFAVVETSLDTPPSPGPTHLTADLSLGSAAEQVVDRATDLVGPLYAVVCIAGRMPVGRIEDATDADLDAAMRGSFATFFNVTRAAVTQMPPGGSIVAVSSVNATLAAPGVAAYAASKGAVDALVRQVALDQASRGIRVNAVAPGLIDDGRVPGAGAGYPRGTAVTTDEVAAAIGFLASPSASGITGVVLPVDAGLSITSPVSFLRQDLAARLRPSNPPRSGT